MLRYLATILTAAVFAALAMVTPIVPIAAATTAAAEDVVTEFHDRLIEVWQQSEVLTPQQRYERLEPAVTAAFDLTSMIRVASGAAWARATEAERDRLQESFTRFTVANYVDRFTGYAGQRFEVVAVKAGPRDLITVEARIVRPRHASVPLSYVLSTDGVRPQVVDVIFKGVSEVAVRRSDFRTVLRQGGPDGLAERLNEQATALLERATPGRT
ncbi:MAG: hypothetical protein EA405_02780 [Rhodospirillales bacterium]|nr:MAG: hypothetical protein EA405_02780 [Rhodospirillales bacterium]